eukprot:4020868-Pleurochrysis_carterae.AAC.1
MRVEGVLEVQGFQVANATQREHGVVHAICRQCRDGLAFGPAIRRLAIVQRDCLAPHVLVAELFVEPDVHERNELVRVVRLFLDVVAVRVARFVR